MLETNIRIVYPGSNLYLRTKRATVEGSDLSPDLLQRACNKLLFYHGLAARPCPTEPPALLVATTLPIPHIHLQEEQWELEIVDANEPVQHQMLSQPDGAEVLPSLIERSLIAQLVHSSNLWNLDSPRIWYQPVPFLVEDGIAAYRRYELASLPIDDIGVGVSVDVGTAFFTSEDLAYFFDPHISTEEQTCRANLFTKLTNRQAGQKGSLLYDNGRSRLKCYFESASIGTTCASTGKIRVKGDSYDSLLAYYRAKYPDLPVTEDTPAVRVSFPGIDRPQWVAADRLRIRIMNESLPKSLSGVDKLNPAERHDLVQEFWSRLGPRPFGKGLPGLLDGFWRPEAERIRQLPLIDLTFGQGEHLAAPTVCSQDTYRSHYRQRSRCFEKAGCYSVPPAMTRTLYYAYPTGLKEAAIARLATDLTNAVSQWTECPVTAKLIVYASISDAIEQLRAADRTGTVIFVLNKDPIAYHEVAFQLDRWRVKRLTLPVFQEHYQYLQEGYWNKRYRSLDLVLGERRWKDYITENTLAVLQLLDVVPYRLDQAGIYEAQLVIDVGRDRRHFALSLLIARNENQSPHFRIISHVYPKPDHQHETINPVMLEEHIVSLFKTALHYHSDPIRSLLVLRDGQFRGQEIQGVDGAIDLLLEQGKLAPGASVHLANIHKDSLKSIRLWDVSDTGDTANPLEGTLVWLNKSMVVITPTGAATLHQGTAEPFIMVGNGRCPDLMDAAQAAFAAAQLNWSSPAVAQRLPLPLKRTDEELKARADQEIKRFR